MSAGPFPGGLAEYLDALAVEVARGKRPAAPDLAPRGHEYAGMDYPSLMVPKVAADAASYWSALLARRATKAG
jgi:hypothetical protein